MWLYCFVLGYEEKRWNRLGLVVLEKAIKILVLKIKFLYMGIIGLGANRMRNQYKCSLQLENLVCMRVGQPLLF